MRLCKAQTILVVEALLIWDVDMDVVLLLSALYWDPT